MLISHAAYIVALWVIFLSLTGWSFYVEKVAAKKKNMIWLVVLALGLVFLINKACPYVYMVYDCGSYEEKILIAPMDLKGTRLSMWNNKSYVNNIGGAGLYLETIVYGDAADEKQNVRAIITPADVKKVPVPKIDFIFEEVPQSVSTKASTEIKYHLDCMGSK